MANLKILLILMLFFSSSNILIGQNRSNYFSINFNYHGGISYRQLEVNPHFRSNNPDYNAQEIARLIKQGERRGYAQIFSFIVERKKNKPVSFYGGINFQSISRFKVYDSFSDITDPRNPQPNTVDGNPIKLVVKDYDRYFGLQFGLGLRLFTLNHVSLSLRFGINPCYYLNSLRRSVTVFESKNEVKRSLETQSNYRKLSLGSSSGIYIEIPVKSKISINTSIANTLNLQSTLKASDPFIQRWFSFCIGVGLCFNID
jgi:hypothetical protein